MQIQIYAVRQESGANTLNGLGLELELWELASCPDEQEHRHRGYGKSPSCSEILAAHVHNRPGLSVTPDAEG